jgi:hypothetical protein
VFIPPWNPGDPHRAVISISCDMCGVRFQFADGDGALCFNDARTEMSAWVLEALPRSGV